MTQRRVRRKLQTQRRRRRIGLAVVLVAVVGIAPFAWHSLAHAVSFFPGRANTPTQLGPNNDTGSPSATENSTTQATSALASTNNSQATAYDETASGGNAGNQANSTSQAGSSGDNGGSGNATSSGTATPSTPATPPAPSGPESDTIAGSALKVQPETAGQNNTGSQNGSASQPSTGQAASTGNSTASNSTGSSSPTTNTPSGANAPTGVLIKVPAQDQLPALPNGCEVTSLSMLFTAVGHPVSNATLADEEPTDPTKLVLNADKTIRYWGDPNKGFVGDVRGYGYGIYHGPIVQLINRILPGRAEDLSGQSFSALLQTLNTGKPVMVWTTSNFKPEPASQWMTWNSPDGPIHATMWEHAVLLVGYDAEHLYINDPLDGAQAKRVDRSSFIAAWQQMGQQAVTIRSAT